MKISNNSIRLKQNHIEKLFSNSSRFKREKYFYLKFKNESLNIPRVIKLYKKKILFEKYKFQKLSSQKKFFDALLIFLIKTNQYNNYKIFAKENLISYKILKNQIKKRFDLIANLKVEKKYSKKLKKIKEYIHSILFEKQTNIKLKMKKNIISQSDIGFHNCGILKNKVYFYDFEYSGLDNPIKLICDVYYQPEKRINKIIMLKFIKNLEKKFKFKIPENFLIFEKLLKVKMMLIILNIFINSNIKKNTKFINKRKLEKIKFKRINKVYKYISIPFLYEHKK